MTRAFVSLGVLALALAACNGLTGVGDYDFNCGDGGCPASSDDGATSSGSSGTSGTADGSGTGSSGTSGSSGADSGCPSGSALVTLTVNGKDGDAVHDLSNILSVVNNHTGSACLSEGPTELGGDRQYQWQGVACDNGGQKSNSCKFALGAAGATVTASQQD